MTVVISAPAPASPQPREGWPVIGLPPQDLYPTRLQLPADAVQDVQLVAHPAERVGRHHLPDTAEILLGRLGKFAVDDDTDPELKLTLESAQARLHTNTLDPEAVEDASRILSHLEEPQYQQAESHPEPLTEEDVKRMRNTIDEIDTTIRSAKASSRTEDVRFLEAERAKLKEKLKHSVLS